MEYLPPKQTTKFTKSQQTKKPALQLLVTKRKSSIICRI